MRKKQNAFDNVIIILITAANFPENWSLSLFGSRLIGASCKPKLSKNRKVLIIVILI